MKRLLLISLLALSCWAQNTLTLSSSSANVKPTGSVTLSLTLACNPLPCANVAGIQWSLAIPTGVTLTPATGAAASGAGKSISCNSDGSVCLVAGLNLNVIPAGVVATYTAVVAANAGAGTDSFVLSNLVAADPSGNAVTISPGAAVNVAVLSKFDLNGDGKVDIVDYTAYLKEIFGTAPCSDSFVGDGKCNLIDLLLLVAAALQTTG